MALLGHSAWVLASRVSAPELVAAGSSETLTPRRRGHAPDYQPPARPRFVLPQPLLTPGSVAQYRPPWDGDRVSDSATHQALKALPTFARIVRRPAGQRAPQSITPVLRFLCRPARGLDSFADPRRAGIDFWVWDGCTMAVRRLRTHDVPLPALDPLPSVIFA